MNEIEKREDEMKSLCLSELDRQYGTLFFAMTLQDVRKSGYPDVVPSALGRTTWWEFKHATPQFRSPGIQNYTCRRLAQRSYCRYVIYYEYKDVQRTAIYHPDEIHKAVRGRLDGLTPEIEWSGLAHSEVAQFMYFAHGGQVSLAGPTVLRSVVQPISPSPLAIARAYHDNHHVGATFLTCSHTRCKLAREAL